MIGLLVYLVSLIPLFCLGRWVLRQVYLYLSVFLFIYLNFDFFFSGLSYFVGVDCFSYGLILLSILITCLIYLCSIFIKDYSTGIVILVIFFLCFLLVLVFSVLNYFLIYLFFEFSLVPLFIMILGWGYQPERLVSWVYLFFYTLLVSLPLFFFIIYLYITFGRLFFDYFYGVSFSFIVHLILILSFLVKFPMFILHFWLPKAHVYSPVFGSIILAGLLLKVGGYGIIRFISIYDFLFLKYSYIWYSFRIIGSVIVSLICLIQGDIKCLIAYSSVAHIGLCLIGLLSITKFGLLGSYIIMISHGLCSSGLFCLANFSYDRVLSRSFYINKGLLYFIPRLSLFWFRFCSFNIRCPPSLNFLREVLIMVRMLSYLDFSIYYLIFISFFSAFFRIYLFSYSQHGLFHRVYSFRFLSFREYLLIYIHIVPILLLVFLIDFLI